MSSSGRIILITNRNVNPGNTDLSLFGDNLNTIHSADLNLANVTRKSDKTWKLDLLTDSVEPDYENPVSKTLFEEIVSEAANGNNKGE